MSPRSFIAEIHDLRWLVARGGIWGGRNDAEACAELIVRAVNELRIS